MVKAGPAPRALPLFIQQKVAADCLADRGPAAPEDYRLYLTVLDLYHSRGGIFPELSTLLDDLSGRGYKGLGRGAGNHRRDALRAIVERLKASHLFEPAGPARYKLVSQDRLGRGKCRKIEITREDLGDKKRFKLLFYSLFLTRGDDSPVTVKEFCRKTKASRAQAWKLIKEMSAAGIVEIRHNYVLAAEFDSLAGAEARRKLLFFEKGMATPPPIERGGRFLVCLFMGNSYTVGNVVPGDKGKALTKALQQITGRTSRPTPTRRFSTIKRIATLAEYSLWGFIIPNGVENYIQTVGV